ncbi:MAG: nucleotidyltransferase domain-containing protein [Deltaproteobacteria bacterium]|nr:nucleotidyltransferase domain-containing protein [Deltaproteobacteria bacterium]MBW2099899.1 nucleotidyltransferase domain-containing protein [Deltaproteobacteria bacterium]
MKRERALSELREHKQELKKYGVTKLGIFGSVARDEAREESDVDVVVKLKTPDLFLMVDLKEKLESILGTKVDLIRYSKRMNQFLKNRIDKEALYV